MNGHRCGGLGGPDGDAGIGLAPGSIPPLLCRQMMAFAMLASVRGLHEDAERIYLVLEPMAVDTSQYRMCRAIAQSLGGDAAGVIARMAALIENNPDDDFSRVVMGTAMLLSGHPDGRFALDNVLATSTDLSSREAALKLLEIGPLLRQQARRRDGHRLMRPA